MKRLLLCLLLVAAALGADAQQVPKETKNVVSAGFSFVGLEIDDHWLFPLNVGYQRKLGKNTMVGASLVQYLGSTKVHVAGCYENPNYVSPDYEGVTFLSAMAYYDLRVVRQWLFLRGGLGFGAGYYDSSSTKDKMLPNFAFQLEWVIRNKKGVEFRLSPLLFTPSRVFYAPGTLPGYGSDITFFDMAQFTVGFSF